MYPNHTRPGLCPHPVVDTHTRTPRAVPSHGCGHTYTHSQGCALTRVWTHTHTRPGLRLTRVWTHTHTPRAVPSPSCGHTHTPRATPSPSCGHTHTRPGLRPHPGVDTHISSSPAAVYTVTGALTKTQLSTAQPGTVYPPSIIRSILFIHI